MSKDVIYYRQRLESLRQERSSLDPHWRDIAEHTSPRLPRFCVEERNRGDRRNQKIFNERATLALRTLRSGMVTGVTNPATPWAIIKTPDPDLNKWQPVKMFNQELRDRMLEILLRSNYYTTVPMVYGDEAWAGTSAFFAPEDPESLIRTYHYPVGSYFLAADQRGRINTCYREFSMTSANMVRQFGKDRVSPSVLSNHGQPGNKETWNKVVHAIEPNEDYDPRKAHFAYYKKFHSCFFEAGGSADKKLHEGGYDVFPVIAPRWDVSGEDVYGSDCPGMQSLGAVRQLQLREKRKGQLIDKGVSPPMAAPSSLKNKRSSILSGDITYIEPSATAAKFEPVYQPNPIYYQWVLQDIAALEQRLSRIYFEDLFLMLANDTRSNVTAREIAERHEEKLLQLGPVLMRQNDEHFDLLFDLLFSYMVKYRLLPKVPKELMTMDLNIEYVSILSQAMKMVGVGAIERSMGFAGNVLTAWPEVRHAINPYAAVSEYFGMTGAPAAILNDQPTYEKAVTAERNALAAAQQAAMAKELIPAAADTAKTMSETDTDPSSDNALTRVAQAMTGQVAA